MAAPADPWNDVREQSGREESMEGEREEERVEVEDEEKEDGVRNTCGKIFRLVLYHFPYFGVLALVLMITGLIMWSASVNPALGSTKDAVEVIDGNIEGVVSVAWLLILLLCIITAIGITFIAIIIIARMELDIKEKAMNPKTVKTVGTKSLAYVAIAVLFVIFLCCVLLVGLTAVWFALAEVSSMATDKKSIEAITGTTAQPSNDNELCPSKTCFDASQFDFLNSDQCVCGEELEEFNNSVSDAAGSLILSLIGILLLTTGVTLGISSATANIVHFHWRTKILGMSESTQNDYANEKGEIEITTAKSEAREPHRYLFF